MTFAPGRTPPPTSTPVPRLTPVCAQAAVVVPTTTSANRNKNCLTRCITILLVFMRDEACGLEGSSIATPHCPRNRRPIPLLLKSASLSAIRHNQAFLQEPPPRIEALL